MKQYSPADVLNHHILVSEPQMEHPLNTIDTTGHYLIKGPLDTYKMDAEIACRKTPGLERTRPRDEVAHAGQLCVRVERGLSTEWVALIIRCNCKIQKDTTPISENCTLSPRKHCLSPFYIKRYMY